MQKLVATLQQDYPHISFREDTAFCWSPSQQQISYTLKKDGPSSVWALLHELGHALLEHDTYHTDIDLVLKEVAAWDKATQIASQYGHTIDDEHIQDCLDTYRDWLDQRSTCPTCGVNGIQDTHRRYKCINCAVAWEVSPSRFCRPYRQRNRTKTTPAPHSNTQATFQ
jgi:hypothetical protein